MEMDSAADLFHLAFKRYEILQHLAAGRLDKRTVAAEIEASRPTLDRAYRELEDVGVLTSTGTAYELTTFGKLLCREFVQCQDTFETLTDARDVLAHLPQDAAVDMRLLEGATIHRAEANVPQKPQTKVAELAVGASEIEGYSRTLNPHYASVFHSLVVEEGVPVTLVFTEDVVAAAREQYPEKFAALCRADQSTIYSTPTVDSHGLLVADGTVGATVGEDRDNLQAVIINDSDAAVEWAREYFDRLLAPEAAQEL